MAKFTISCHLIIVTVAVVACLKVFVDRSILSFIILLSTEPTLDVIITFIYFQVGQGRSILIRRSLDWQNGYTRFPSIYDLQTAVRWAGPQAPAVT